MQEKVTPSTSHMTDDDRMAIAIYLKSLPARRFSRHPPDAGTDGVRRGHVRRAVVHVCHLPPGMPDQRGAGALPDYPKLAGDTLVMGRDPTTVARIILEGAESPVTTQRDTPLSPCHPSQR